jgi:heat-inducible transcriptional repressor
MRQIDPRIQEERKQKILQAVIHHFIKTAKPVGSHILNEEYGFDLSPATIRNLMAELEEDGYLTHPHTSAGRVPTDKGYRTYVDSLIELQRLAIEEEDRIRNEYNGRIKELEELLVQTSRILSGMSQYTGFVLTPKLENNNLKHLELIPFSEDKILVILVTHTGMVKHHLIEARVPRSKLQMLSSILNEKLKGMTLLEARQKVMEKIEELQAETDEILSLARTLGRNIFEIEEELYLEGTSKILSLPEFQDYEPMRCLLRLNDDRDLLMNLLGEDLNSRGVQVHIGSESPCSELQHLSVVSTVYRDGDKPLGVLGIIGPKRMEYEKMMALVDAVSKIVNKMMSRMGG